MTPYPFLLFNQTPAQLRRIGSRGGKAQARNRRARQRTSLGGTPAAVLPMAPPVETTAQAMVTLDAKFAWLRHAELRSAPRRAPYGRAPR